MSRYARSRPYAVPGALTELTGPTSGVVTLPTRLHWGPDNWHDLSSPQDAALLYERVIREAATAGDLGEFLDGALLVALWPRLVLPQEVPARWETAFPELATARDGAAA